MPARGCRVTGDAGGERDVEDVVGVGAGVVDRVAVPGGRELVGVGDHALGEQEAEGEVEVVDPEPEHGRGRDVFGIEEEDAEEVLDVEQRAVEETTVARAETPPAHAHVVVVPDDNPWA